MLSRPPLSFAICTSWLAARDMLACSEPNVRRMSSSSTMSLSPSEHSRYMSPSFASNVLMSASTSGSMPTARVTRFLFWERRAISLVIMPLSICSCSREWSRVSWLSCASRRRYRRESPTWATVILLSLSRATTSVVPMPAYCGWLLAAWKIEVLARATTLRRMRVAISSPVARSRS